MTDPKTQTLIRHFEQQAGGVKAAQQLQFDPTTGELVLVSQGTLCTPDAVTVDQIAEDGFFFGDEDAGKALRQHFAAQTRGAETSNELRFDPMTGQLVLVPRGEGALAPDAVTVDQIAEDGFFAERPVVYLHEDALKRLVEGSTLNGIAYSWDENTVLHAHPGTPTARPAGLPLACGFLLIRRAEIEAAAARALFNLQQLPVDAAPVMAVIVTLDEGRVTIFALLARGGAVVSCEARLIPTRSDLFSRSQGLLETDVLARRTVVLAGVGSGGSTIAVELAKAGVGSFVLIDPDRLELANVARHVCGVSDLGRLKTRAVRDAILEKNPRAVVETHEIDVNADLADTERLISNADLIVGATDGARSRFNLNRIAVDRGVPAIFGRAITRAAGGDVLRVRPGAGPCLACVFSRGIFRAEDDEVSTTAQAQRGAPAYARPSDATASVQPGLSTDIAPISHLMVRLALVELSRGTSAAMASVDADLTADLYLWANRREQAYAGWAPMGFGFDKPSVLRWYGARVDRDPACGVCGKVVEVELEIREGSSLQE